MNILVFLWQMIKMSPFYFTWHTLCCLHSAAPSQCFGVRCHAERIRPPGGLAAQRGHGLTWRVLQGKKYVGKKAKTITNASYQMQLVVTNVADPEPNKYGNSDPVCFVIPAKCCSTLVSLLRTSCLTWFHSPLSTQGVTDISDMLPLKFEACK